MSPLNPFKRHSGVTARRASLAVLLAFVWQLLAMPVGGAGRPMSWAEACTPAGIVKVALGDDSSSTPDASGGSHCTWCQVLSGAAEPPAQGELVLPLPAGRAVLAVADTPRGATHTPWARLPIRAPPSAA